MFVGVYGEQKKKKKNASPCPRTYRRIDSLLNALFARTLSRKTRVRYASGLKSRRTLGRKITKNKKTNHTLLRGPETLEKCDGRGRKRSDGR